MLSKALGSRTVMSGSVSRSKNDPSQSLQMIERPLMTPDELKSLPKGTFVVMKTGFYPMKVKLKLFLNGVLNLKKSMRSWKMATVKFTMPTVRSCSTT